MFKSPKAMFAIPIVVGVILLIYLYLYTTESYKAAVRAVTGCENVQSTFVISPLGTSIQIRGEEGTAVYGLRYTIAGERREASVSMSLQRGRWTVGNMLVNGHPQPVPNCMSDQAQKGVSKE
jgi:hypothetical protein